MADSDSYSDASYKGTASPSVLSHHSGRSGDAERRKSPRSSTDVVPEPPKKQARLPDKLNALVPMKNHVSGLLQAEDYDTNTSLRVIHAALEIQESYLRQRSRVGKAKASSVPAPAVRAEVCRLFAISESTYSKILREYLMQRQVYVSGKSGRGRSGNTKEKPTRIPRTKKVAILIRDFFREKRKFRERVTAVQVMDFLTVTKVNERSLLVVDRDDIKSYKAAIRSVQRLLIHFGYKRGKRKDNIIPNEANLLKRDKYLVQFFANRAKPPGERLREVYTDESYLHLHHNHSDQSVWNPADNLDLRTGQERNTGRRFCFCTAIQGQSPIADNTCLPEQQAGMVPNSLWLWSPDQKGASHGDYHKVFNGGNYVKWWKEQLLPNLLEPSIIITDNAAYHLVYNESVPKPARMKREDCIAYLNSKGVAFSPRSTVLMLKAMVREYIKTHEKPEIVRAAEAEGHEVLFTPPHHSDFQPIEYLWACVKGRVARKYTTRGTVTLQQMAEKIRHEFWVMEQPAGQLSIMKMIQKSATTADSFRADMENEDGGYGDDGNNEDVRSLDDESDDDTSLGTREDDVLDFSDSEEEASGPTEEV
jgi:hypothetical protein